MAELLVVLGIIASLAAMLLPQFARARDAARLSTCAANERRIGSALLQYVQDNDRTWPAEERAQGGKGVKSPIRTSWQVAILSYVKDKDAYRCPANASATLANPDGSNGAPNAGVLSDYVGSVTGLGNCDTGPNGVWEGNSNGLGMFGAVKSPGVRAADVPRPESTIAVYEAFGTNFIQMDPGCSDWSMLSIFNPHVGRSNYLFADGHVEALAPWDTVAHGENRWFRDTTVPAPYYVTEALDTASRQNE